MANGRKPRRTTPLRQVQADGVEQRVEIGQPGRLRQGSCLGEVPARLVAQRLRQQERADPDGDVVEHDRRDHLVDTAPHLEHAGDRGVRATDDDRHEEHERDVDRRRQGHGGCGTSREQRSQLVLPGGADVEQVHLEPDGHGHTCDVVRHGPVDDADERVDRVDRRPHLLERRDRVLVGDQQRDRRHDDGDGGGESGARMPPTMRRFNVHPRSPSCSVAAPVMYDPRSAGVTCAGSSSATTRAAQHDEQAVGQADQLLEVGGDEQRAESLRPGVAQDVPDHGLRADVDAAGRVGGDEHQRVAHHLAADDQLLLVAARQRERGDLDPWGAHVEARDDRRSCADGPACGRRSRR